ncbi:MAG TPA: HEAT repeat domain-containing protein [Sedimentisphaerales bacterium]|nr:HEAT repeat domain-containing protein [Sedimentisphaerales bacterium]
MKTLTITIISLLLIVIAFMTPALAGPASVLLQEGLYAEEIEGDLDGAIKIYEQVLAEAKDVEQTAAQATYRIGLCHLKKGDKTKAASYFQSILREYPDNEQLNARAKEQLNKVGTPAEVPFGSTAASLYEKLPPEVIQFVGNKYGSICAEARAKKLYSNSHVYYVTSDFVLLKGGMGYYHNLSDKALFNKIRLCGTSEPNQTHYDIAGREMNTEIVPDKVRQGFYHIYWTPHQPVPAGEMFYYGWCIDRAEQLPAVSAQDPASDPAQYKLTMQNQFGNHVVETFFLVLPVNTRIISRTEDYTAKDTIAGFDVYCFSKEVAEDANHQVEVVLAGPAETKTNLYERLPNEVLTHIGGKYGSISAEAGAKSLYSNSHIYCVTSDWVLLTGGMGYYRNGSDQPRTEKVRLSGTSSPKQTLYDVAGRQMNIEIVPDKARSNFYHIYWTPSEAIPPGQMFYYGWSSDQSRPLQPAAGAGQYSLTMQNHFGERVVETFFLVAPVNTSIISRTEEFTAKDTVGGFDIYYWSKEAPPNTDHTVDVTLGVSQEQVAEIVRKAVLTISTCAESDPKVAESLDSLKPFKDGRTINELCKYLESDTATVRRSAIFILWRGGFKDIAPAEDKLLKLCGHEENLTRGMSLLALGAAKVAAGYEILADKTVNDSDGYVRRCAAYALGLYGDKKAVPVLEKALQDKDQLVKNNAQAAITMLTELKDSEQK